jgi:3-deoxy-D-arabino-heptulosonate 7-phosphate (DAHP) synthase
VENETQREEMSASLAKLIPEARIEADAQVIVRPPDKSVIEIMHAQSQRADVVFLGLKNPDGGRESEYAQKLFEMAEGLNTTIFVHNASEFAGSLI